MTSNRTLIILIVAVFVLGVFVVYTNSKIETAALQGENIFCEVANYSFCDEFTATGMNTVKWQAIVTPDQNNWIQRGDGIMDGNPRAATIPAYSNFTYEAGLNMGLRADLVMRYADATNYYTFKVVSSGTDGSVYGRIIPAIMLNGSESTYDPVYNERISTLVTGSNYTLKIVARGNKFDFYVNGQSLGSWTDQANSLPSGRIGFLAGVKAQETKYDFVHIIDDSAPADSGSLPGKVWQLLTQGAGKSGKVPQGIQQAPGLSNQSNDKIAPQLSNIQAQKANEFAAQISWETDEDSTSVVVLGTEPGNYNKVLRGTTEKQQNNFGHGVSAGELMPGTNYYYKILSADQADNFTFSDELTYPTQ